MRVAYLTSVYPAPSHTFIRREVHALRERGIEIHTFSVRQPPPSTAAEDIEARDTTFYLLPANIPSYAIAHASLLTTQPLQYAKTFGLALKHRGPGFKNLVWAVFYFAEAMLLAHELKLRRIEHVHNHFANPSATVSFLATRFLRLPWSLTLHGNSETDYPAGLLLGEKLKAADFANCVCYYGRAQAYRTIDTGHWAKLEIVRCGIDLATLPPRIERPAGSAVRVISVARLTREKGHAGLLRAYAWTAPIVESELIFVGDGPERRNLVRDVEELGLSGKVRFFGSLAEGLTLREIAKSDILVLASLIEGLPVVLLEAMALGIPVIAPNVAGIPDLIQDGRNGLLFPPTDWDALQGCLGRLMSDPELRERLGSAGRFEVESRFEINTVLTNMVERFGGKPIHETPSGTTVFARPGSLGEDA